MATTSERKRIIGNPGRRHNPGDIIGFNLAAGNPGRKAGSKMAKTAKKKKTSSHRGYAKKHAKHNPGHKMTKHRPRTNAGGGGVGSVGPMVTNAVFVIVGALGSKLGAQAVLGTNNVGLVGYAGNAAAGGILWFLTEKVMRNRAASSGVIAGTIVQIVLRIINDYTPFGGYLAQLGMGDYQMQSFVTPQVLVNPWKNADIRIPAGWAPRTIAAPAAPPAGVMAGTGAPGMGGLYDGSGLYA